MNMKKKKKQPPREERGLPPHYIAALGEKGITDIKYSVRGDMSPDGLFCDSALVISGGGLFCVTGEEIVPLTKKGRITPSYRIDSVARYDFDPGSEFVTERFTGSCRLVLKNGETKYPVIRFTNARLGDFSRFVSEAEGRQPSSDLFPGDRPQGPPPGGKKSFPVFGRLLSFFRKYIPAVIVVTIAIGVAAALQLLIPQIGTRKLFDEVLSNPDGLPYEELLKALGVLVGQIALLKLLKVLLDSAHQYIMASVTPRVAYNIKVRIFENMQRLSMSFYSSKQTGSLMERVSRDSMHIYWFLINDMPDMFINLLTIIGVFAIMFAMSVKLSLIVLVVIPPILGVIKLGDNLFEKLHHANWVGHSRLSSLVSDNIAGARVIKAFSGEDSEIARFGKASGEVRDAELKLSRSEATIFPVFGAFVTIVNIIILAFGGVQVADGKLTTGTLLSFIVYVEMLSGPFDFLASVVNRFSRCMDSASRVFEIVDAIPDLTEKEDAVHIENFRGEIDIKELEFEYEPARPVIKKTDLHVSAGEMLGIVGKTGAGKTTIAQLIARLYDPTAGKVLIDGIDAKDIKLADIRKNVGMVSQDIFLFRGSIADNIRYAKPDATMEEVIAAAKAASAHKFIMKLPDAYETNVGAGGQELSGGEKQRVSIARTIIQNPKILILDEATAAMDTETERNIQYALSELSKERTTIAIAHRLSTLRDSDHLAVIDKGEITEYGTYAELLEKKGDFYRLYTIQQEALNTIGIGDDG